MKATTEKIVREINTLSPEEMLALHAHLLSALYAKQTDAELDPAFRAELTRRIDEIDSGKVAGVDAFDAIQSM
jgi:putative addiction module component (TIGR02574 family)